MNQKKLLIFYHNLNTKGKKMAWKKDENGNIAMKDGLPICIFNGEEKIVEDDILSKFATVNSEAKNHRLAKEEALEKLKNFEGIDIQKAKEALEIVKDKDLSKMVDSGKLEEAKNEIKKQYELKISEKDKNFNELSKKYDNMMIDNLFGSSEFVRNNIAVPADMFKATFRNNFKVEDGKITSYKNNGDRLYSIKNSGEFASPEEALEILANEHPSKDKIIKATLSSGSGGNSTRSGSFAVKEISRSDFSKLSPKEQSKIAIEGKIKIVD